MKARWTISSILRQCEARYLYLTYPRYADLCTCRDENDIPVYKSSWLYIGLAIMVFMLGWIGTVPVFFGWWHLGRAVTMSPVEIGKAFGAPSLDTGNSNAEVKTLLEEVGKRKVQYGAVTSEAAGEDHARLLIGETNLVREPDPGKEFVG